MADLKLCGHGLLADCCVDCLRARVAELHAALDLADCTQREGGDVRHCGEARCWRCRAEAAEKRVAELERENTALRGITPELPPRPPDGDGMPRYGLRWNGPTAPLSVPMADGYWTPWHLAQQRVVELEMALDAEKKQSAFYDLQAQRIMVQRDAAAAELNDAWKATEVAGAVRGLTTLADVVAVNRQNMKAAESRASAAEQRVAELEQVRERLREDWYAEQRRREAAEQRVRELEARLQFDPGGSDKIDELDQVIQFLRHELDVTRTELGLKRSDCVRLGMDCDALKGEKKAAEQRAKRLEAALKQLAEMPCEIVATFSTEDESQPSCVEIWPDPRDEARALCGTCTARELRAALAAGESQAADGGEVSHA